MHGSCWRRATQHLTRAAPPPPLTTLCPPQRSRHPGGTGLGGLELEGPACPDYYRVRQVLYEAYTMV
jgi:hypothetical protein